MSFFQHWFAVPT